MMQHDGAAGSRALLAACLMAVLLGCSAADEGPAANGPAGSAATATPQSRPAQTQSRPAQTQSRPTQTQSRPAQTRPAPPGQEDPMLAGAMPDLVVDGDPVVRVLPRDAIASLDAPVMVTAEEGDGFMQDDEPVLGVVDGGQARAYSTWHLDRHEVVNDHLGETPIAATW